MTLLLLLLGVFFWSKRKQNPVEPDFHVPEMDGNEKAFELPVHGKGFDQKIKDKNPDAELASSAEGTSPVSPESGVPNDELALAGQVSPTNEKEIYEMS